MTAVTAGYEQIVNEGLKYINGLNISNNSTTPNTKLDVALGQCRDSTNVFDINLTAGVTINFANNGINGLDTGSIAASTWYYIFVIADPIGLQATGAIASTSATPLLPFGYLAYRQIGWALTDASSHILKMNVSGDYGYRYHQWDTHIQVLDDGTASTLTAVDCSSALPPIQPIPVNLSIEFTPATADDYVSIANGTSTATALPFLSGVVAAKKQKGQLKVTSTFASSLPKIQYINSAASCNTDIFVDAFEYFV